MRNLADLNINDGGRPIVRPAPSQRLVTEFEREFDVRLPADYLELLTFSNGGHPELNAF